MAELIKFWETVGNVAEKAFHVGQFAARGAGFVVDRFHHDAWSNLPHPEPGPVHPPVRASVSYPGAHDVPPTV